MKIAQNTQSRLKKMQKQQKIHLSEAELIISTKTSTKSNHQFQQLYEKIENVLKVFEMKNFRLLEGCTPNYYRSAEIRYSQILEIYTRAEEELPSTKSVGLTQQQLMETCKNVTPLLTYSLSNTGRSNGSDTTTWDASTSLWRSMTLP